MARVLALVPDLLFGSRVQAALAGEGHEVELIGERSRLERRLADRRAPAVEVLVVDLDGGLDAVSLLESVRASGAHGSLRTLGFYSHVHADVRARAEQAGFDLVVPRSRMAREGAALLARLPRRGDPAR